MSVFINSCLFSRIPYQLSFIFGNFFIFCITTNHFLSLHTFSFNTLLVPITSKKEKKNENKVEWVGGETRNSTISRGDIARDSV